MPRKKKNQNSYEEPVKGMISRRFDARADIDLRLTSTLNIRSSFSYDVINSMIVAPRISIIKYLDCWELSANWYPTGFNQGFIIRFAAKASQLRDLQLIKRNLPLQITILLEYSGKEHLFFVFMFFAKSCCRTCSFRASCIRQMLSTGKYLTQTRSDEEPGSLILRFFLHPHHLFCI